MIKNVEILIVGKWKVIRPLAPARAAWKVEVVGGLDGRIGIGKVLGGSWHRQQCSLNLHRIDGTKLRRQ